MHMQKRGGYLGSRGGHTQDWRQSPKDGQRRQEASAAPKESNQGDDDEQAYDFSDMMVSIQDAGSSGSHSPSFHQRGGRHRGAHTAWVSDNRSQKQNTGGHGVANRPASSSSSTFNHPPKPQIPQNYEFAQPTNSWKVYSAASDGVEETSTLSATERFISVISSSSSSEPQQSHAFGYASSSHTYNGYDGRYAQRAYATDQYAPQQNSFNGKKPIKEFVPASSAASPSPSVSAQNEKQPSDQNRSKKPQGNQRRGSTNESHPTSNQAHKVEVTEAKEGGKPRQQASRESPTAGTPQQLQKHESQKGGQKQGKGGKQPTAPVPSRQALDVGSTSSPPPTQPPAAAQTPKKQQNRPPQETPKSSKRGGGAKGGGEKLRAPETPKPLIASKDASASAQVPSAPAPVNTSKVTETPKKNGGGDAGGRRDSYGGVRNGLGGGLNNRSQQREGVTPGKGSASKPVWEGSPRTGDNGNRRQSIVSSRQKVFEDYLSRPEVEEGLKNQTLYEAIIRINKRDPNDAYVTVEGMAEDVYISGKAARNRAFDGDLVVIKILEGEERKMAMDKGDNKKAARQREDMEKLKKCAAEIDSEVVEEREIWGVVDVDGLIPTVYGKVVFISEERANQTFVGTLTVESPLNRSGPKQSKSEDPKTDVAVNASINIIWFKPSDRRVPFFVIPVENAPHEFLKEPLKHANYLWTATVKKWPSNCLFPYGSVHGCLGMMGELASETQALLLEHGIYWDEFSEAVLACLPATPWQIPATEVERRRDFRNTRIFSVDPATARDLDDALSVSDLGDGTYQVGVHIADVSHFVEIGSALDEEAFLRATTVYLVQKAIPMLPRLLCEELCSLNPGVDRLAFSVLFHMNADGKLLGDPWFGRSIIRSCAKLSYDHAQALIDNVDDETFATSLPPVTIDREHKLDDVRKDTVLLHRLSVAMRKGRFEGGALAISSTKLWFAMDDVGNPVGSGVYELKESNRMIEEFMLLANMAVAQRISAAFPETALLRRHEPPKPKPLRDFVDMAGKLGYAIDPTTSQSIQGSFDAIRDPNVQEALRQLCIKPMQRAKYFCTGLIDLSQWGHYALCVPLYTHFTSPIRRYCDLVVHRLLDLALQGGGDVRGNGEDEEIKSMYTSREVGKIAKRCNERKFSSKDAQDASQRLYLSAYLSILDKKQQEARRSVPNQEPDQKKQQTVENDTPQGIVSSALVYKVGDRSFDVLIGEYGIEKRVWVDDLVESGDILACQLDTYNNALTIYWRRVTPLEGAEGVADATPPLSLAAEEFPALSVVHEKAEKAGAPAVPPVAEKEQSEDEEDESEGETTEVRPRSPSPAPFKILGVDPVVEAPASATAEAGGEKDGQDLEGEGGGDRTKRRRKGRRARRRKSNINLAADGTAQGQPQPRSGKKRLGADLLDPRKTLTQIVKVFENVPVRIFVDMKRSPPDLRLRPVYPEEVWGGKDVYDVTEFVNDHPGGADLVLQYAGTDATAIMKDHFSHEHSDAAYSMLDDFYIGELDLAATKQESAEISKVSLKASTTEPTTYGTGIKKKFIDVTKPMLSQVFYSGFSKDFYMEQVHIPRTCKGSAPIFGSPTLEIFTKTPWWVIPLVYIPITLACENVALKNGLSPDAALCWFGFGLLVWTFIEYTLHRFLFHIDELLPDNSVCITLHFLLHGIHHFLPMDRMRLVMPPALGLTLSIPFYLLVTSIFPMECGYATIGGAYFGFMAYDLIHYYLHHGRPATAHLREMKSYHLDHHYKNAHLGYGITSKLWDYVFNTVLL
ncbi:hypothetical protein HDU67_002315 [Dinochytrium kinnereticum]|nr:hypothetical protein HDU67_002315 [Dinochytrium kinnereticum]